jgi:hypothetical protein
MGEAVPGKGGGTLGKRLKRAWRGGRRHRGEARSHLEAAEEGVLHGALLPRGLAEVGPQPRVLHPHEVHLQGHPGGARQGEKEVKGYQEPSLAHASSIEEAHAQAQEVV